MAKTSKSQIAASLRYRDKSLDRVEVTFKKGDKDRLKQEAKKRGLGLMQFIRLAIDDFIKNHPVA